MSEYTELCLRYLDGDLTEQEAIAFDQLIRESPEAARELAHHLLNEHYFAKMLPATANPHIDAADGSALGIAIGRIERQEETNAVLHDLLDMERQSPAVPYGVHELQSPRGDKQKLRRRDVANAAGYVLTNAVKSPKARWGALLAAVLVLIILLAIVLLTGPEPVQQVAEQSEPSKPVVNVSIVATLTDTHNAKWDFVPGMSLPQQGKDLYAGQRIVLAEGIAEITTSLGAVAVLEAPCTVELTEVNALRLIEGKLVGLCETPSSKGFVVETLRANVIDLGTEFGVMINGDGSIHSQVYQGEIEVLPLAGPTAQPVKLLAGDAIGVEITGAVDLNVRFDPYAFVRPTEFDVLAGHLGPDSQAAAVHRMWKRNPALVAADAFAQNAAMPAYGWEGDPRVLAGKYRIESAGKASSESASTFGGRLVMSAAAQSTLFFDLDLSQGSKASQAGLIVPGQQAIGADGTRLCLSWIAGFDEDELAVSTMAKGHYLGLSLFADGDDFKNDELVFFGMCRDTGDLGVIPWRVAPGSPKSDGSVVPVGHDGSSSHPLRVRRWLVVIDFRPGPDRVSVFLDPEAERLGSPDVVLDHIDIQFDRLRVEANLDTVRGYFDEFRIGTDVAAVLTY